MPFKQDLPRSILELRFLQGLSERLAAERMGLSVSTLSRIESGQISDLNLSSLLKIGGVLHASPDYLLCLDSRPDLIHSRHNSRNNGYVADAPWTCMLCGTIVAPRQAHPPGLECIVAAWDACGPHEARAEKLATLYHFTPALIRQIVAEYFALIRRARTPPFSLDRRPVIGG